MDPTPSDDAPRWYCLHTKTKCEHIAAANLAQAAEIETFCPRIRYRKSTRRGRVWFQEALFPGYVFARFPLRTHLRIVNGTHGVLRVVRFGENRFPSVPDAVIESWRRLVDENTLITVETQFRPGDEVEVVEGPLRGIQTVITQVLPAKERVRILLELLGEVREVQVSLDALRKKENIRLASPAVSG
jgi:transcriptional antiterminator RfaH